MTQNSLVHEFLTNSAKKYPNKNAIICEGKSISYSRLDQLSLRLAVYLKKAGVNKGDRVLIYDENSVEAIISIYAILKAGGAFVVISPKTKLKKLTYIIKDSSPSVIIAHTNKSKFVLSATHNSNIVKKIIWCNPQNDIADGDIDSIPHENYPDQIDWKSAIKCESTSNQNNLKRESSDIATIIYTSGSTGEPKGVVSSHYNVVAAASSIISYLGNDENDMILMALPLSFDYGLYQIIMSFMYGGTIVLERSFAFPYDILKKVGDHNITGLPIVPTVASMFGNYQKFDQNNFKTLRYVSSTGSTLQHKHIANLRKLFGDKTDIFSMYGLTECKRVSYLHPRDLEQKIGSVGKPMKNVAVHVEDSNGNVLKNGEIGELVVSGPNVMQGYWNNRIDSDQKFKKSKSGDNILYSGDLFKIDNEGFLYFVSRTDEMLKVKDTRVYPKEIEDVLQGLDEVESSAVIGIESDDNGIKLIAFVALNEKNTSEEKLQRYCKLNLEKEILPDKIIVIESMPVSENGKIDKRVLKDEYLRL